MDEGYSLTLGQLTIHASIISTWCVMVFIISLVWLATRDMNMLPCGVQTVIEGIFEAMEQTVLEVTPEHGWIIMPFISTL